MSNNNKERIGAEQLPLGMAARLSRYLQVLTQAKKMGKATIASQELAEYTHVNPTQIRRDLSSFGKFGKRGIGYNIDYLLEEIRAILHHSGQHNIALFGAGHLGSAIATSGAFADHGFKIAAIFDSATDKIGQQLGNVAVSDIKELKTTIKGSDIVAAVLAVPDQVAQDIADQVISAGIRIIFNYSNTLLQVPPDVTVHASNPAADLLYALYFYLT